MGYSVRVDPDRCMSTGNCVRRAPDAFGWDDDDLAVAGPGAAELSDADLILIAKGCPVGAITLRAADGTEIDPYNPA